MPVEDRYRMVAKAREQVVELALGGVVLAQLKDRAILLSYALNSG
jgi:hypothetical protein